MSGRRRWHTLHRALTGRAARPAMVLALAVLMLHGPFGVVMAQDTTWHPVDRVRIEADGGAYLATLAASRPAATTLTLDDALTFRLSLEALGDGNATPPGPTLALTAWRCGGTDASPLDCPPGPDDPTLELRDNDDGRADLAYSFRATAAGLDTSGLWAVRVGASGGDLVFLRLDAPAAERGTAERVVDVLIGADDSTVGRLIAFVVWFGFFLVVTWLLTRLAWRTVLSPNRVDPTIGRLTTRLVGAVLVILGLGLSLSVVWGVNFWAGLTALGLLSVALGFGMQTTVANLMGGINLALDRPFVIGDRIQVGETWGDVQEIGLRSTRILTTKSEVVVIPNKVLDEREIWNYTISHPELRVDIEVSISYDSDRRLAEALVLQAARDSDDVLAYPRPRVLLQAFGESGLDLQLRCWIPNAKDARPIASELRKKVFDAFLAHGVEIPFPYRVFVDKEKATKPHQATEEELAALRVRDERLPRLVYVTAQPHPLERTADLVASVAEALDLGVVFVHALPKGAHPPRGDLYRVLAAFGDAGARSGVPVETLRKEGDLLDIVREACQDHDPALLVLDARRHSLLSMPRNVADVARHVREEMGLPLLILPRDLKIGARTLKHYREVVANRLRERREEPTLGADAADDEDHGGPPADGMDPAADAGGEQGER